MIHFIDQTSEKDHHAVFNSSCIKILQLVFPDQIITYHGIESNQQKTAELLAETELNQIIFKSIFNPKVNNSNNFIRFLNLLKKEKIRYKIFKNIFISSSKSDLIFHSITTFTAFYGLKKLKTKFDTPVIAALHGDLDFLYNATNLFEKLIAFVYKSNFKIKTPNFYYLLLNKISKQELIKSGYLNENEILEIDHPYNLLHDEVKNNYLTSDNIVTFGHIGSMEVIRKCSHLIYKIALNFEKQIQNKVLQFDVIGLVTSEVLPFKNDFVNEISGNLISNKPSYLDRNQYENAVNNLNYSLFFYDNTQYIFRTSGAIADAIGAGKPLIVLKHPIFDYIFENAGNVGYVCENLQQMEHIIKKISEKSPEIMNEYSLQIRNLKLYQNMISVSFIASDLKKQMIKYFLC